MASTPTGRGPLWKQLGLPSIVGRAVEQPNGKRRGVVWLRATTAGAGPEGAAAAAAAAAPDDDETAATGPAAAAAAPLPPAADTAALQAQARADLYWIAWRDGDKKWTYEGPAADLGGAAGAAPPSSAVGGVAASSADGGVSISHVAKPGIPFRALSVMLQERFEAHPLATRHLTETILPAQARGWRAAAGGGGSAAAAADGAAGRAAGGQQPVGSALLSPGRNLVGRVMHMFSGVVGGGGHGNGGGGYGAANGCGAAEGGAGGGGAPDEDEEAAQTSSPSLKGRRPPPLVLQKAAPAEPKMVETKAGRKASGSASAAEAAAAAPVSTRKTRAATVSPKGKDPASGKSAPASGKSGLAAAAAAGSAKAPGKKAAAAAAAAAAPPPAPTTTTGKKRGRPSNAVLAERRAAAAREAAAAAAADDTDELKPTEEIVSVDPEVTRTDEDEEDERGSADGAGADSDDRGTEDEAVVPSPTAARHGRGGAAGGSAPPAKRPKGDPALARPNPKYSSSKGGKGGMGGPVSFRPSYADAVGGRTYDPALCRANGDRAVDEYSRAAFDPEDTYEIERFLASRDMRQRRADGKPAKAKATRYVLVKWKGFELDVGDARRNGGWERLEALREGDGRVAADEAWAAFSKKGGAREVEAASARLGGGPLAESEVAWLQAAPPAGAGGKKGKGGK